MKLEGKSVVITGGGTGIGKATAILFAEEGAKVLITGRREEKLKEVQAEVKEKGFDIDYFVSDVAKEEDCKAAVDYAHKKYGRIDILFNNAGVLILGVTHEVSTDVWDKTFSINVRGTYLMSKYTIPHMLEQGRGWIVNNSSVVGLKGFPGAAAYVASKGAVTQLTRSMALEYADQGINVNAICPGVISTPMIIDDFFGEVEDKDAAEAFLISQHPIGRLGDAKEIAHSILFLCDENIGFMTGTMLSVDGGWVAR